MQPNIVFLNHLHAIMSSPPGSAPSSPNAAVRNVEEKDTPLRKIAKQRPTLPIYKPTRSYSVVQQVSTPNPSRKQKTNALLTPKPQKELLNEFIYCEMEFETSKKAGISKKVIVDPSNLPKKSIAMFWNTVAENATKSPSFLQNQQTCIASTAKSFCEDAVESKMKRMDKGETHEGAFVKTGEGDDDDDLPDAETDSSKKKAELVADLSYQIEQMLHVHVCKIKEREENLRTEQHSSSSAKPDGQSKIPAGMKRVMNPPADPAELAGISLSGNKNKKTKGAGDGTDDDKANFKAIRAKQADKQLKIASDFNALATQLIAASTQPQKESLKDTEESQIRVAQAQTQNLASACESIATKVVQAWRAPAEVQKKEGHLVNINTSSLHRRICDIGDVFKNNVVLENALLANGIDGAMLSFMSDQDVLEFFTSSCDLNKLQAAMLLAKIKSWD
jgi:hypothetical protein